VNIVGKRKKRSVVNQLSTVGPLGGPLPSGCSYGKNCLNIIMFQFEANWWVGPQFDWFRPGRVIVRIIWAGLRHLKFDSGYPQLRSVLKLKPKSKTILSVNCCWKCRGGFLSGDSLKIQTELFLLAMQPSEWRSFIFLYSDWVHIRMSATISVTNLFSLSFDARKKNIGALDRGILCQEFCVPDLWIFVYMVRYLILLFPPWFFIC